MSRKIQFFFLNIFPILFLRLVPYNLIFIIISDGKKSDGKSEVKTKDSNQNQRWPRKEPRVGRFSELATLVFKVGRFKALLSTFPTPNTRSVSTRVSFLILPPLQVCSIFSYIFLFVC